MMLNIGAFSKICQVSVKTLHYYDKIGLLQPAHVDPATGYRYYEPTQLDRMLLIGRLKRYGFALEDIRLFLDCDDDAVRLTRLKQQERLLQQEMHGMAQILRDLSMHLKNFERTGNIMDYQKQYEIHLVTAPETAVCVNRQIMSVAEFGNHYSSIFERLAREHLTPNGLTGAVYHDAVFDPQGSDIELVVGVQENAKADKTIGGQRCAMTVHHGAYTTLSDAYAALVRWIEDNGYTGNGAPFEFYRKNQFDTLDSTQWETDIYFPIA